MADGKVTIGTELDSSGVSSGMSTMSSKISSASKVGVAAIAAIGTALVAVGTAAVVTGSEYETAIAKLATIADTSTVSISSLSDDIISLSNETGESASALAEVAYNAISAGVSTEDSMEAAEQSTKLATAGFTDSSSALSVLTTAMNAYGDSAGSIEDISDSLIQVQNLGVTTVAQLSSTIGKAIATGSAYGVSLGNVESAYVSMTKQGIGTAEATTYMSSMFSELGDSSSDVGMILQDVTGESFGQLMADGYSLSDVMGILSDSVDGDSEALMNLWSSQEAGKGANAIVNEGLDEFNENLLTIQDSSGATEEAYATMMDTLSNQTDILKAKVTNALITLFNAGLGEAVTNGVKRMSSAIDQLAEGFASGGTAGFLNVFANLIVEGINLFASSAGEFIDGLGDGIESNGSKMVSIGFIMAKKIANGLSNGITTIVYSVSSLASSIGSTLQENLPDMAENALIILDGLVDTLAENAGTIVDAGIGMLTNLAQGIANSLPVLIEYVPSIVTKIANIINDNAPKLLVAAANIIWILVKGIIAAIPTLVENIPQIFDAILAVWEAISWVSLGGMLVKGIKNGLLASKNLAINAFKTIRDNIVSLLKALPGKLVTIAKSIPSLFAKGVKLYYGTIWNVFKFIVSHGISLIKALGPKLLSFAKTLPGKIVSGIKANQGNIWETINNIKSKVISLFKSMPEAMKTVGINLIKGLWNGVKSMASWIKDKLSSFSDGVLDSIKDFFGIASPSKVMRDEVGVYLAQGVGVGFEQEDIMGQITSDIETSMGNINATAMVSAAGSNTGTTDSSTNNNVSLNFYDTQTSPDQINRTLNKTMRYGLAGGM